MKRCLVAVVLALLLVVCQAYAEPVVRTFDNGMTVVVDEVHAAPVAAVRFYVRAGSMYEDNYLGCGITHFLEHLVGRGSTHRTAEEINAIQEALGNQANAYTSVDHTCYWMTGPARKVEDMVDLISDYVFNPLLTPQDVETQRGVILREMAMGEDNPGRRLSTLMTQTLLRLHPARYRIIGYPDRFKSVTREDIVSYHQRMYTTDNVVAVVVGDFETDRVMKALEQSVGRIPRRAVNLPTLPQEPAQTSSRRVEEVDPSLSRAYLALGWRTVTLFSPDMYPLDVADYILSNGPSSRLGSRLREEKGLVDSITSGSYTPAYDGGRFVISAVADESKLAEVEKAILAEVDRLKTEPVSAAELSRAKKQKESELVYARASVDSWAEMLGSDYLYTGDVDFSTRYVEGLRKVTAADIQAAASRYFRSENLTVVVRRAGKGTTQAQVTQPVERRDDTRRSTLPNGITVLVREDHRTPMVSVQASWLGGLRYETAENAGIGRLLAAMITRGTRTRSRQDIAKTLDDVAAGLSATSGRNSFSLSGTCLTADLNLLMTLLTDCVRNPSFPAAELDRVKQLTLAAIKAQEDDPDSVVDRLLVQTFYQQHPYRLDPLGTPESVASITREKLIAHHAQLCRPSPMVLSIYGDVKIDQALALAKRCFGDWTLPPAQPVKPALEAPPSEERRAVKEREQEQGLLYMAFPGPTIDAKDRFALDVLDAAFSGINYPGGRLHEKLRGAQLVYATHLVPAPGIDPGYVLVYAATQPEKLQLVEKIIRDLIAEVQQKPLSPAEFARAKKMCIAAHEIALGDVSTRLMQETLDELYGLGYRDSARYAEQIEAVSLTDVQAAARKYLNLEQCAIAITRPAATKEGTGGQPAAAGPGA